MITHEVLRREFIKAADLTHLNLAISLTEHCNFRCSYCYESFELGSMSNEYYEALRLFARREIPKLKSLSLNWFGGEPLLEWRRIAEFTRECKDLAAANNVFMHPATMPTNAWALTPDVMQALCGAGVCSFMISLDGLPELHNTTRKLISGKGTFERIYNNLLTLRDTDLAFTILLRLHLHEENLESQVALAHRLASDFGSDRRFSVQPVALGDFGGEGVKSMKLLQEGQAAGIEQRISSIFRPQDQKSAHNGDNGATPIVCYASKPNHIFIRPDGRLAKCTSALERDDNNIGRLNLDGSLAIDEEKALAWSFGFRTGNELDLSCPLMTKPLVKPINIVRRPQAYSVNG